jgi:hypothetical protein
VVKSLDGDHDYRRIVLKAFFAVAAYCLHQSALDLVGGRGAISHDDVFHAVHAELLVVRALDFGDAVGVEHQAIAGLELELGLLVCPLGKEAEYASAYAQFERAAIGTDKNGRIMSGIAVAERP